MTEKTCKVCGEEIFWSPGWMAYLHLVETGRPGRKGKRWSTKNGTHKAEPVADDSGAN